MGTVASPQGATDRPEHRSDSTIRSHNGPQTRNDSCYLPAVTI